VRVAVTGASGFIGTHLIPKLLKAGHTVTAIGRSMQNLPNKEITTEIELIQCDLNNISVQLKKNLEKQDALIHLAWSDLSNYRNLIHLSELYPLHLRFLKEAASHGIPHIQVAGTCLEYGNQFGLLSEDMMTSANTPYGLSKDSLRRSLEFLQSEIPFTLQWFRIFYVYGVGQNSKSLYSQLNKAIELKEAVFKMSQGDQIRDFISVDLVAEIFCQALKYQHVNGVINCCSGQPTSVIDFVEGIIKDQNASISLLKGFYPRLDYEPLAFWGNADKLRKIFSK
jgi:dTDP-6-deoxy-L-talose 4-dehydrogenase (NAD+)